MPLRRAHGVLDGNTDRREVLDGIVRFGVLEEHAYQMRTVEKFERVPPHISTSDTLQNVGSRVNLVSIKGALMDSGHGLSFE